jgi:uncharacterized protein
MSGPSGLRPTSATSPRHATRARVRGAAEAAAVLTAIGVALIAAHAHATASGALSGGATVRMAAPVPAVVGAAPRPAARAPRVTRVDRVPAATAVRSGTSAVDPTVRALLKGAYAQVGVTVSYDAGYARLDYPGGDVDLATGVCTDVVVRAYRSIGIDLQQLVHEDMKRSFSSYPARWGLKRPDPNIDHRRVGNLQAFFSRRGTSLTPSSDASAYRPGDLVTWNLGRLPHIGIVSDRTGSNGAPLIIHNVGRGTLVEDVLFSWPITGHYRYRT